MSKVDCFSLDNNRVYYINQVVSPDNFDIICQIGTGANGVVYKALDLTLNRNVAIKLWYPKVITENPTRALEEAKKIASIDSNMLITIHGFGITGTVPYLVMQLVNGQSLKCWLKEKHLLLERYWIWNGYFEAMTVVYSHNILHGDPHTGNVMIPDGALKSAFMDAIAKVKLADLGTSCWWDSHSDFQHREIKLLIETCEKLFPENTPKRLLKDKAFKIPHIALHALNAYSELLFIFNNNIDLENDWGIRNIGLKISLIVSKIPLFELEEIWKIILSLNLSDAVRSGCYLGGIDQSLNSSDGLHSAIKPRLDNEFPNVLKRYNDFGDSWLIENQYTIQED